MTVGINEEGEEESRETEVMDEELRREMTSALASTIIEGKHQAL
jgi:hypothetical protein